MRWLKNLVKNPLFSGVSLMILGSNAASAINYLYHAVMGRLLGPSGYGDLAALFSFLGIVSMIPASLGLVVVKFVSSSNDKEEIKNFVGWLNKKISLIAFVFFIIISLSSSLTANFLHIDNPVLVILVGGVILFS